ncbi:MAG: DUF3822 family protein [Cryomorphaceae bacterium]|nr:DUF3822 family protein [Cryomorphaceae bacterium]
MPSTPRVWSEPSSGLKWHDEAVALLVPKDLTDIHLKPIDPDGRAWFCSPLDDHYNLVYRFADGIPGAQPLSLFNVRRWLNSQPMGRTLRVQQWDDRLEVAALDGTRIKYHAVHRARTPEDAAYFVLLTFDQLDWSGASVPVFWEGIDDGPVRHLTQHFIAHWHVRSLEGILLRA